MRPAPSGPGAGGWAFLVLRLFLAGVFLYASLDKIARPGEFADLIRDYRIVPGDAVPFMAVVLPWLEAVLGVFLILGAWRPGTLFLVNALLVAFWLALASAWARGIDVDCGCFSTARGQGGDMAWYLVRDGLFVLAGLAAWRLGLRRPARGPRG